MTCINICIYIYISHLYVYTYIYIYDIHICDVLLLQYVFVSFLKSAYITFFSARISKSESPKKKLAGGWNVTSHRWDAVQQLAAPIPVKGEPCQETCCDDVSMIDDGR